MVGEREAFINIYLDKYNLIREKSCVHLLLGKAQYQESMRRE